MSIHNRNKACIEAFRVALYDIERERELTVARQARPIVV